VKKMNALGIGIALLLGTAQVARADEPSPFTFALHGFVSFSMYAQDAQLNPSGGQQSLYATHAFDTDKLSLSGDVRQSRFNFSVAGPKVLGGATPKGVLEIDFFQGNGAGGFGDVSLLNRMRLAYVELDFNNGHRLAFGQMNDLIFAIAPTSLAHIAFPAGYVAGNVGWRRPAIWGFHTMGGGEGLKSEFAWEIGRSQWNENATAGSFAPGAPATFGTTVAEASGLPAVEARYTVSQGKAWSAFVTGHWNTIDENGVGVKGGPSLQTMALNVGGKVVAGPLTVQATGFTGKNLAPLIGNFLTFQLLKTQSTGPLPVTHDDLHEMGGWVQAGFNFTKELSLWGEIGTDKPNWDDVRKVTYAANPAGTPGKPLQNVTTAGMLAYRDGGFAYGLEWFHFHTKYQAAAIQVVKGDQWLASFNYFF